MNLLIPTNDGISIASNFDQTHKFRLLSIVNGSVAMDEIRVIEDGVENEFHPDKQIDTRTHTVGNGITSPGLKKEDAELHYIILANNISEKSAKKLCQKNFEVLLTRETNITNAIIYFLKYHSINESEYCCSP